MRTKALALVVALLTAVLLAPAASAVPVDRRPTHVLGLRFATHPDFDRVVIDLRGSKPFFRTGRAARFSYEGSGKRVPIRGAAGVYISLTGSGHGPRGNNLYTGPRVARPRFDTLKALAITGDVEGQVTFAFALRHRAAYTVRFLPSPSRLVIDFRHR